MRPAIILLVLTVAGCAGSGEPVPAGPDTWMLADGGYNWSSGGQLTAGLLRQANAFCHSRGQQPLLVNSNSTNTDMAHYGTALVYFRCLTAGDPGLRRPNIRNTPDMVIENR